MFSDHGGSSMQTLEGKGHKRKVTAEEAWIEDCESEVSGGSSSNRLEAYGTFARRIVVLKTTKKKKLSRAKGEIFSALDEEDESTVTSVEVDEEPHQQHKDILSNSRFSRTTVVDLDSMDYDVHNNHINDREKEKLSVSIVEIDVDSNNDRGDDGKDEEDEVASPVSTYVLSSGRQTQPQAQPKVLTIDDEFEEYFRQLML